jgi:hypothetical protein
MEDIVSYVDNEVIGKAVAVREEEEGIRQEDAKGNILESNTKEEKLQEVAEVGFFGR